MTRHLECAVLCCAARRPGLETRGRLVQGRWYDSIPPPHRWRTRLPRGRVDDTTLPTAHVSDKRRASAENDCPRTIASRSFTKKNHHQGNQGSRGTWSRAFLHRRLLHNWKVKTEILIFESTNHLVYPSHLACQSAHDRQLLIAFRLSCPRR